MCIYIHSCMMGQFYMYIYVTKNTKAFTLPLVLKV